MKKFLSITAALVLAVIIAFALFIKFYITPERVKEFVIPAAESSLGRKVEIGDISINVFKGIGLKEFAVKEADGKKDFVKCRDLVLKFKLFPLLHKKVIIDELKLVSPEIRIYRSRDGKYNFEDIGQEKIPEDIKEEEKEAAVAEGLPVSLLVSRIKIEDAGFTLTDLTEKLPDIKSSADIDIGIESTDGTEVSTQGSIDLRLDELNLRGPSEKKIKNINAALKYAVHFNLESFDIKIDRGDLYVQGIPVSMKGSVRNTRTSPDLDMALSLSDAETSNIQELAALFADMKGLKLSGSLSADVKVKGKPDRPDSLKTSGSILMRNIGVMYEGINARLDGSVKFSEKLMDINIETAIGKNSADLKGSIANYLGDQDIKLDIYSKKLSIDELIPAGKTEEKPPISGKGRPSPEKSSKEAVPLDLKLSAKGEIRVDSASYRGLNMSDLLMRYSFKNNKLSISNMTANAGKGKLGLKSLIDLSRPGYKYDLSCSIDSLHADEVVNSMFPSAKDTVFGTLSFDLKLNGAGTLPENIKKNLKADGKFNIKDGKITDAPIAENLSRFLNIGELKTINLKKAEGSIKIRDRVARLDSDFISDDLSMDPKGKIGLDETLNLAFDLKLSPRLTDKAMMNPGIAKFFKNDDGWGVIPLKISGTFERPSYAVDIEKAGKRAIKKEADKLLEKIFQKNDKDQDDPVKQLEKPLKELFQGVF